MLIKGLHKGFFVYDLLGKQQLVGQVFLCHLAYSSYKFCFRESVACRTDGPQHPAEG